jgi:hypothetical protein
MSDKEEHLEALSEEFEAELIENRPSLSWSDVAQDTGQELSSDSEGSSSTPSLAGSPVTGPTPTMSGANTRVDTGDGVMVDIATTPRTNHVTTLGGIMFCKEDHAQLSMEKRTELFDKITNKSLDSKFTELSISLTDVEKLDDTYTVAMLVDRVRDHCIKYDLHGVFNIADPLDPESDPAITRTLGNLFLSYSTLTEVEVAHSNEWYRRWAVSDEYENNLRLSMDFLEHNTSEALWEKTLEAHSLYPVVQQGDLHPYDEEDSI